jgi:protein-disulfide isomerase
LNNRIAILSAAILFTLHAGVIVAQPPASAVPSAPSPALPPPAPAAPVDPLPPANAKFFTAASPSLETVNSFLKQIWGNEPGRLYRVMAIQPTVAPGVVKVTVFVTSRAPDAKVQAASFYVTPDGRHAIADGAGVIPFGAQPFADTRDLLRGRANGAFRGAASKDLELVEFADLQCPHCKEAQPIMDQIVQDFPNARVVFQPFPLAEIHSSAAKATAYGICVQQQSNEAFFKYAQGVFDTQEALTPATDDTLLKAAAMRAGLDGAAIAACAATPAVQAAVQADIKLATEAGIDQTPLLSINGRVVPLTSIPYEQIKRLIQYQADLDGVKSGATAETLAPKPVQPTLLSLPK